MLNNFRAITHLDTLPVMPWLVKFQPSAWKPVEARGEYNNPMIGMGASLLLRGHDKITKENWLDDLPVKDQHVLAGGGAKPFDKPWESMKRLLAQARKAIMAEELARRFLSGTMGRAMISRLDAGSSIFWHTDDGPYHERHIRFHLPLVTNPGCLMYSQSESLHMPAGSLWFFNNRVRHSAANWGTLPRLHLILEMRKSEAIDDDAG
jgi:Aspartyl/Asparaginyl beta-hydroxylase